MTLSWAGNPKKQIKAVGESVGAGITNLGTTAQQLARKQSLDALNTQVELSARVLERFGVAGVVAAETLRLVTTSTKAFRDTVEAFVQRGRELSEYPGQLATANAVAEIRKMQANMREAQGLGPGLSQLTDAQSRLETVLQDLLIPIKKFLIDSLGSTLESVTTFMERAEPILAAILETAGKVASLLFDLLTGPARLVLDLLGRILQFLAERFGLEKPDKAPDLDPLNILFELGGGFANHAANLAAAKAAAQQQDPSGRQNLGPAAFAFNL